MSCNKVSKGYADISGASPKYKHDTKAFKVDTDSFAIEVDGHTTRYISNNLDHFITPIEKRLCFKRLAVQDFGGGHTKKRRQQHEMESGRQFRSDIFTNNKGHSINPIGTLLHLVATILGSASQRYSS
eukprot:5265979-Ditylum_brightwellii.AAC.1